MTATHDQIILAHGGGGDLTRQLIDEHIIARLGNDILNPLMDSAILPAHHGKLCMTTDSFVVQPIDFPGGDIGKLAVCGTVNDIAVMGARPIALSLGLIIEEGLSMEKLDQIINSIAETAEEASVRIVTGDTKVIERRNGDGIMINTTGLGEMPEDVEITTTTIKEGHAIILTGNLAEHGLAVMSAREGLAFDTDLRSDVAPLNLLVQDILATGAQINFMRDPTRGGVAGVLADLVEDTNLSVEIDEAALPITGMALHTAETLGLDPLTIANEGKVVIVCPKSEVELVLAACRSNKYGRKAVQIGRFTDGSPALIEMVNRSGGRRIVQRPYGEELPRIC